MAASVGPRKSVSIYDYPEHLNPFREEDNHNKIRFWTLGRKLNRSNSITFTGIKDLKNSWAFRSFMKKGKKPPTATTQPKSNGVNGDANASPIIYRRTMQSSAVSPAGQRMTLGSPERSERYVYGGSVTPLPRSRFQERLRSASHQEVGSLGTPRMARSEISGSRLSVESTNPFDDDTPLPPVRHNRRKKKRAPLPPSSLADTSVSSADSNMKENESLIITEESKAIIGDKSEDVIADVELQIVEDEDVKTKILESPKEPVVEQKLEDIEKEIATISTHASNLLEGIKNIDDDEEISVSTHNVTEINDEKVKKSDSEEDILDKVSFPKVDIHKYRRNSSINEDDIKLRRGNLEDFHTVTTKRSKSLNNDLNLTYVSCDININEDKPSLEDVDANGNDQPKKVVCKLYENTSRKQSLDNSISSTEREFIEIAKATREFEREISKLSSALSEDDGVLNDKRLSVSDIKKKFDNNNVNTPNPIPKPRRSPHGSPVNGNYV